jgi:hypothetical protein
MGSPNCPDRILYCLLDFSFRQFLRALADGLCEHSQVVAPVLAQCEIQSRHLLGRELSDRLKKLLQRQLNDRHLVSSPHESTVNVASPGL